MIKINTIALLSYMIIISSFSFINTQNSPHPFLQSIKDEKQIEYNYKHGICYNINKSFNLTINNNDIEALKTEELVNKYKTQLQNLITEREVEFKKYKETMERYEMIKRISGIINKEDINDNDNDTSNNNIKEVNNHKEEIYINDIEENNINNNNNSNANYDKDFNKETNIEYYTKDYNKIKENINLHKYFNIKENDSNYDDIKDKNYIKENMNNSLTNNPNIIVEFDVDDSDYVFIKEEHDLFDEVVEEENTNNNNNNEYSNNSQEDQEKEIKEYYENLSKKMDKDFENIISNESNIDDKIEEYNQAYYSKYTEETNDEIEDIESITNKESFGVKLNSYTRKMNLFIVLKDSGFNISESKSY